MSEARPESPTQAIDPIPNGKTGQPPVGRGRAVLPAWTAPPSKCFRAA